MKIRFVAFALLLSGCWFAVDTPTYIDDFATSYFDVVYISRIDDYIVKFGEPSTVDSDSRHLSENEVFDVYQDEQKKCYLFSFSWQELIDWGKDYYSQGKRMPPVYIIGKDKISVVSRLEYENMKSTFVSHPYDISLCKANPTTE